MAIRWRHILNRLASCLLLWLAALALPRHQQASACNTCHGFAPVGSQRPSAHFLSKRGRTRCSVHRRCAGGDTTELSPEKDSKDMPPQYRWKIPSHEEMQEMSMSDIAFWQEVIAEQEEKGMLTFGDDENKESWPPKTDSKALDTKKAPHEPSVMDLPEGVKASVLMPSRRGGRPIAVLEKVDEEEGTPNTPLPQSRLAEQLWPGGRPPRPILSFDCEMVQGRNRHGRVELYPCLLAMIKVNANGSEEVYTNRILPACREVIDWKTEFHGLAAQDFTKETAIDFQDAKRFLEKQISDTLAADGIIVGHGLRNDFAAMKVKPPRTSKVRDTATFFARRSGRVFPKSVRPRLKALALAVCGMIVQVKTHSPLEDARAPLRIYAKHADLWDRVYAEEPVRQLFDAVAQGFTDDVRMETLQKVGYRNEAKEWKELLDSVWKAMSPSRDF